MDPGDALQLFILILLLALSAFFSSSETALTSVSRIRIRTLVEQGSKRAKIVQKLKDNQPKMLSAILIGNNVVNLSASSLSTVLVTRMVSSGTGDLNTGTAVGIATGILTFLILIFGEIAPKNTASVRAEKMALAVAPVINALTTALTPVIFVVNKLSSGVMYLIGVRPDEGNDSMTESDLRTVIDVSHQDGVIESEEKELITNVVDFGDTCVSDVMVPRIDVTFIDIDSSYEETVNLFREVKYARIPVYTEDKDHIRGVLNLKDLFCYDGDPEKFSISDIMRKPYFTYDFRKTSDLMMEMRKSSISMEIVLDEYGAVAGIVTLEDLLEEIVGDIRDEYDAEEAEDIRKISDTDYLVDGNTKIDDIDERFGLDLESEDYDSIAGYMIDVLEHIPSEGESTTVNGIRFTVRKMDKNRIDTIEVKVSGSPPENTEKPA